MPKIKIIRQAGAIPYLEVDGQLKTVLVTARSRSTFWLFPKGHIDDGLLPTDAAALEAYEEAGVRGLIRKKAVGTYSFTKLGRKYKVKLYPLKVKKILKKWPESNYRVRHIVSPEEAMTHLEDSAMKVLANKLFDRLRRKPAPKLTHS